MQAFATSIPSASDGRFPALPVASIAETLVRAVDAIAHDDATCEAIVSALVARALAAVKGATSAEERPKALLPKWRLKRVVDHVDAHLDRRVTLDEMARAAGLTRMYFAAQFRRTTGVSPHGYLLRRRIERAQELMRGSNRPLAQIALSVGFGAQPHFTTVFKRLVGQTPYRWRQGLQLQA